MYKIFCGKKFKFDKSGYMHIKGAFIHRIIWEMHYGPIPKGFDVHHKDSDKSNNAIWNLQCLSHSEHLALHMKENSEKVHAWHKTEEGRKTLGEHAKEVWKNRKVHTLKCSQCGNAFEAKQIDRAKYCDSKCEQAARRARGIYLVDRQCVICDKTFKINKYYLTKTCGYECGGIYKSMNSQKKRKHSVK